MRWFIILAAGLWSLQAAGAEESVRFDFETGDLQGWKVVEGNFQSALGKRPRFNNPPHAPHNRQGKFCLSTLEGEADMGRGSQVGVIESPVITLAGKELSFLLAGGNHDDTYAALCDEDGRELRVARGRNSEPLERVTWDVAPYAGHKVFLKIVDLNPGAWGYLECDDFTIPGRIDRDATEKNFAAYAQQKERVAAEKIQIEAQRRQSRENVKRQWLKDPALLERGGPHIYAGEHLKAIEFTVGGIGSGCLVLDGAGRTRYWQIFNNFQRATVPESFLAVRAKAEGRPAVVRAVQTLPVGPLAAMQDLTFRGEYPFAWYRFVDPELPVRVSMEVFNPLIPLDEKNSAIPCAIWKLTAENPSTQAVEVSFLAAQQNAVGCIGNQYGGNVNQVLRENGTVVLHMTSRKDQRDPRYGDMALAMLPAGSAGQIAAVHGAAAWAGRDELAKQFAQQGTVAGENTAGPTAEGRTIAGALAAPLVVPPGGQATVTVLLTWHFPNARHGGPAGWTRPGNMYANWWGDALDVLRYVQANLQDLDAKTRLFHDSLYATNLPYWLLDRISSQNAIFKSKTYWWSQDGYLGAWEGCCPESGCCEGNATHVGGYVVALPRLFPALGRRMREEALSRPQPSGAVPVRQTQAHLGVVAFDGLCHEVITCYREHLTSTSGAWLGTQWPGIKKSLDAAIARWDADEDGFLAGHKHGIDVDHSGCDPWLGGLYLCALAAAERMALLNHDAPAAARYGRILAAGKKNQNQRLWNGEYFIQIPDPQPGSDYNDGSYIDALLGQWHACQLDLGWMYPPERVQSAAGALFQYNFRTDFHGVKQVPRKFVADDDPGMQMGAWPRGPVPPNAILYHDEVMSGFEYTAAVAMVQAGLLREGFAVVRAAAQRYDGRLREGLTPGGQASWGFSGNPFGDDECGKYYKRAMSIWSMLLACQGLLYDGPAAKIGFLPAWKAEDHCSLFTAAEGWGLFTQKRAGAAQSERIELRCGRLAVRTLVFAGTEGFHPSQSKVTVAGKPVQSKLIQENGRVTIRLDDEYRIQASEVIEVELR